MTVESKESGFPLRRVVAVAAVLIAVVALVVWVRGEKPPDVPPSPGSGEVAPLKFPPFQLDTDAIVPAWEQERAVPLALGDEENALLDAWHRVRFAEGLLSQGMFEGDLDELREDLDARRVQWTRTHGTEDFLRLGWEAFRRFDRGIAAIVEHARQSDRTLSELLRDPLDPIVHAYYESGGDALVHSLRHGIIGEDGEFDVSRELLAVLFRYSWASDLRYSFPIETLLPGPELREFSRWQVETVPGTVEARLGRVDKHDETFGFRAYPADYARAMILISAERIDEARAALERARAESPGHPLVESAIAALP